MAASFAVCFAAEDLDNGLVARIAAAEKLRDSEVGEVRSIRKYTLQNPKWKNVAYMEARVIASADGKKHYEILQMKADRMQRVVFQRLLDGEVQAAQKGDNESAIVPAVYDMKPMNSQGLGGCQMVELIPKKRSKLILEGKACVDLKENAVVRLEGRTTKSVSFWVGRPYVRQEFRKVGNYWYSSRNSTTADVTFFGTTELTIEYLDYSVTPKQVFACIGPCVSPSK